MKIKRPRTSLYIILLLIGLCLIIAEIILLNQFQPEQKAEQKKEVLVPGITEEKETREILMPESALIPYPSEYNFAQSYNNCGPYNTAAVVRSLIGEKVSSEEFSKTITQRIQYNWTLPDGLIEQLNQYKIKTEIPDLKDMSDGEKISYLRQQLISNHPVILLIKKDDFQHYITLFGFDSQKDEFYIYDSLTERLAGGLTKDENKELPGNKTITKSDLLDSWAGGELLGKYHWYAIVCMK